MWDSNPTTSGDISRLSPLFSVISLPHTLFFICHLKYPGCWVLRRDKIVCLTPLETGYVESMMGDWIDFSKFDLDILRGDVTEDDVCVAVADATIILGDGRHQTHISRRVIEAAPRLGLIQMFTVGYDEVDLEAADEHGIPVSNAAGCNAVSVAEHAMMFMLVLLKKGVYAHESTLRGMWPQMEIAVGGKALELGGRTLGILGLGDIGTEVAKRARAFGSHILYHKRSRLPEAEEERRGVEYGHDRQRRDRLNEKGRHTLESGPGWNR
jgi:lactate dehydrogenase-like 2-hydroxyacid dehydrogenase